MGKCRDIEQVGNDSAGRCLLPEDSTKTKKLPRFNSDSLEAGQ
jgi:hypothetical protein